MEKNMGLADRITRAALAVIFVILYLTDIVSGALGITLLVLAIIFILTSIFSFCPLYTLVGISTSPKEE